ncbi:MAG TPA: SGNH/GDSL hydrolase family protein [Gemmatimonadaceae bacterium]|nr:SGNH/GDSL hydrolase family protein [Gemmatimonadaceae bacterium]
MIRRTFPSARALAAVALAMSLAACADDPEVFAPEPAAGAIFQRYVSLGNSITAGFQSGGINDSTQRESYAFLLAQQMYGNDVDRVWRYPSLAGNGCPPPVENFQTQVRVGGGTSPTECSLRNPSSVTDVLNNVGVPNAFVLDLTAASTANSNALTTFILGGVTQVERARMAQPTFASVWTGNNDVLIPGLSGLLVATPNVSPGLTAQADFETQFDQAIDGLTADNAALEGVLIGVVDVTNVPLLFPPAALFNPAFKAGFDQFAGQSVVIHSSCTPTTVALISFRIVSEIRAGTHPAVIACARNAMPGTLVGDIFILDAAEIAAVKTAVAGYNAHVQARATELGWAYVDVNPTFEQLKASGEVPVAPNLASATQPFGQFFSLDGVHPSVAAHTLVANVVIEAVNATYGTSLASIP